MPLNQINKKFSHKTIFYIVTTIGYALSSAMNKSLLAVRIKINTGGGDPKKKISSYIIQNIWY